MLKGRLKLILYSWILYGSCIAVYTFIPFYNHFLQSEQNHFFVQKTLLCILCLYSIFILLFKGDFLIEKERVFIMLRGIRKIILLIQSAFKENIIFSPEEKTSLLLLLVKFYFIPLMALYALTEVLNIISSLEVFSFKMSSENIFYYSSHFMLSVILFVDIFYYFVGYIIESRRSENVIISVESTVLGWFVVLICYPPFNTITYDFLGWAPSDFRDFGNLYLNIVLGVLFLVCMCVYVWATISLGSKASNLTNRGIVSRGAYKFVRHPAYIAKNLAWWIMGVPLLFSPHMIQLLSSVSFFEFFSEYVPQILIPILSLSAWSGIYYLRAITEERHLSQYPAYRAYMAAIPYRFIPKVW